MSNDVNTTKAVVLGVVKQLNKLTYKNHKGDICPYEVYVDTVKSNLKRPCFVVLPIFNKHKILPSNQFEDYIPMQIVYISSNEDNLNFELMDISSKLNYLLEIIEIKDFKVRGFNMKSEELNKDLIFYVDYRVNLHKINNKPKMSELTMKNEVKE